MNRNGRETLVPRFRPARGEVSAKRLHYLNMVFIIRTKKENAMENARSKITNYQN
jgi:hypothetical protein